MHERIRRLSERLESRPALVHIIDETNIGCECLKNICILIDTGITVKRIEIFISGKTEYNNTQRANDITMLLKLFVGGMCCSFLVGF